MLGRKWKDDLSWVLCFCLLLNIVAVYIFPAILTKGEKPIPYFPKLSVSLVKWYWNEFLFIQTCKKTILTDMLYAFYDEYKLLNKVAAYIY